MSSPTERLAPRAESLTAVGTPRTWMPWVCAVGLFAALVLVFFVVPPDGRMGELHRIFYFHVASAFAALIGWVGCALLSIGYLVIANSPRQQLIAGFIDRLAHALAEVGVLFGVIVLTTGPLWAKPEWGVFWNWEPRLVLMMLTQFLFIGYLVLRGYAKRDAAGKKLAAGIAVIGGPAVVLIHFAVQLWGGNHPAVVGAGGQGIQTPIMVVTFLSAVGAVLLFAGVLVVLRLQHHKLVDDLEEGYLELADREDPR